MCRPKGLGTRKRKEKKYCLFMNSSKAAKLMCPDPDAKESVSIMMDVAGLLSFARAVGIALMASGHQLRGLEFVCGVAQGGS